MKEEKIRKGDIYRTEYGLSVAKEDINKNAAYGITRELVLKYEDVPKCFNVGDRISGFCNGFFGRDDYKDKVCVGIFDNFAVFQYNDGKGEVLNFPKDDRCFEDGLFWSYVYLWKQAAKGEEVD